MCAVKSHRKMNAIVCAPFELSSFKQKILLKPFKTSVVLVWGLPEVVCSLCLPMGMCRRGVDPECPSSGRNEQVSAGVGRVDQVCKSF